MSGNRCFGRYTSGGNLRESTLEILDAFEEKFTEILEPGPQFTYGA